MTMISRDDLPETPDWASDPRPSPFAPKVDPVIESAQHQVFITGTDVAIADIGPDDRDPRGTE